MIWAHRICFRDAVEDDLANRSKQLREANKELNEKKLAQKSKEKERDMRNVDLKAKEQELRDAEQKIERVSFWLSFLDRASSQDLI